MMTGRDLIIHIMKNGLEDTPIFNEKTGFIGFIPEDELALELDVGLETVRALCSLGHVDAILFNNKNYILQNHKLRLICLKKGGSNV